jgi:hypothetical protein
MVGPSVAPTPAIQIAAEQKFRKPTLRVSDLAFRIIRDRRGQGRFFWAPAASVLTGFELPPAA